MLGIFKQSLVRHLTAGILIIGICLGVGFWFGSNGKAELRGELKATKKESASNKEDIKDLRDIISEIAQQPKISVQNDIKGVKVKDGSQLNFTPDVDIEQNNTTSPERVANVPIKKQNKIRQLPKKTRKKIKKKQEELDKLTKKETRPERRARLRKIIYDLEHPP